ncbi:hypothetical protein LINPERHAP1_LOCUS12058 [Linum perenne]
MRIRVRMDIREPIKREKRLKRPSGECVLAKFRYEKLPTFCFICGRLGHIDRHCEIYFRLPDEQIVRSWDISLRATPRRMNTLGGDRWLVEAEPETEEENILKEKNVNYDKNAISHSVKLLSNLGAIKMTKSMTLSTTPYSKESYVNDADIIINEERKRPRIYSNRQDQIEVMEVDPLMLTSANEATSGIQAPENLATAGLQFGRTCPKQ